jgi:Domain of unknown function (DUF4082)
LTFAAPITITAGTTYIASVHTVEYAWNANYFTVAVSVPPLTTPINAGVYIYGTASAFPSGTYQASNYFVDVLFLPGAPVVGMAISCPTAVTGVSNLPIGAYTMSITSGAKTVSCSGTN